MRNIRRRRPLSFTLTRTIIGGTILVVRVHRLILNAQFSWGVPWEQYQTVVALYGKRIKHGYQVTVWAWKPHLRLRVERGVFK